MNKKKYLFLIICSLFFCQLFSQEKSKHSLPLIELLEILEKHSSYSFSYANEDLKNIKVPEPPNILSFTETIAFLKKETGIEFTIINNEQIAVKVKAVNLSSKEKILIEKLDEVVLTNFIAPGITKQKDGSLEIDYNTLNILPGLIEPDVLQTLQALPGVESVNETVSNINVRGGTNDQNLILWDGIRVYQTGHFFGLISAINPHQNKTVKLYKNGTPTNYGNSVSSVIKLSSDQEVNKTFTAEAGITFLSIDAYLDTPLDDKSSIQFSARSSINNAFITPTYLQYYDRAFQETEITENSSNLIKTEEDFKFSDISFRWLYQLSEKDVLRINYFYITNELEFTANEFNQNNIYVRRSTLGQKNLGMGAFYKRNWTEKFSSSFQIYHTNYNLTSSNENNLSEEEINQENKLNENSFKINTIYKFHSNFQLNSGYEFTSTNIKDGEASGEITEENIHSENLNTNSLFSSAKYTSPSKNTVAEIGIRANYFNKFNLFLAEPRISFNQKFLKDFSAIALGELKSQYTTQIVDFQNDFLGIENRKWQLADQENIPVLRSKQLSLGIHYQKNKWLASIESYIKRVNGITSQSQGFQNQYEYARIIGDYEAKGIDFLISKKINRFNTRVSYSITDNNYYFEDLSANAIPNNFEITNSFTLATSYSYKDFEISSGLTWRSGKPFTPISETGLTNNQFDYEATNSSNLKDYFRVDISASQKFKIQKKLQAYAGISIWNILDHKNIINAYYQQDDNNQIYLVEQKALGLTPNFVFRVKF
ncbi:TonB-dependent Receptor Plug Domain [Mesonia phycicola]|uniref:TonB-dependent Receptor Plug Domain n=1 Tax=Mesonia phycicola TaxID=579105 RepID=A0A1M6AWB3_9FLAO|nr:TonB-dependent Receptor Plug Domain [Mesonia phycicola]